MTHRFGSLAKVVENPPAGNHFLLSSYTQIFSNRQNLVP